MVSKNYMEGVYVKIRDANFLAALRKDFGELVTDDGEISRLSHRLGQVKKLRLDGLGIKSLAGIECFTGLLELYCDRNDIEELGTLPSGLLELDCSRNPLRELGRLPSGLLKLRCSGSGDLRLGELPKGLEYLDIESRKILDWGALRLPSGLKHLVANDCGLGSLPDLPKGLVRLEVGSCGLLRLGKLPAGLLVLDCSDNGLVALPGVPSGLKSLDCSRNELTELPPLPSGLERLYCMKNKLKGLPNLPSSPVFKLSCDHYLM